ncbi:MAG: acyltransferase, partial [Actinobacteria bacterium]|nr:acyltransferase [Actinomycetota bacterium]
MTIMSNNQLLTEATPENEAQYFRRDIQGLRALAVILVILAHAKVANFAGGYIGVDIFFVISGFVITGLLLRQSGQNVVRQLGTFYARRIRRIMPAATLVIIGTLVAAFYWIGPFSAQPLLADARWASGFWANFHFITVGTDYFSQGLPPSLILHYWSLAVEEQFYFVFPLVLFVTAALFGLRRHRVILSVFLGILVAASAIWSAYE